MGAEVGSLHLLDGGGGISFRGWSRRGSQASIRDCVLGTDLEALCGGWTKDQAAGREVGWDAEEEAKGSPRQEWDNRGMRG